MITPAYSPTAAQTVSPKLNLDFTSASLDARVTFVRTGSVATRVNSSGYIQSAGTDVARFDYDPITLACKGLLIEQEKTNLITYSDDISTWSNLNVAIATDTTVAPDNTALAYKVTANTTLGAHFVARSNIFVADGTRRYWSVFVKDGGSRYVAIGPRTLAGNAFVSVFDLQAGVFTHIGSATYARNPTAVQYPNGWWRIGFGSSASTTNDDNFNIVISPDSTASTFSFSGNDVDGIYVWGAQVEVGFYPTSFIPTSGAQVTRTADIATMTSTDFSDWYNASKGTFRTDFNLVFSNVSAPVRPVISADDDTANESLIVTVDGITPKFIVTDGGSEQANVSGGTVSDNTSVFTYVSYDTTYFGIAQPAARTIATSGTIPTVDRLRIGSSQAGDYLNGHAQKIKFWD